MRIAAEAESVASELRPAGSSQWYRVVTGGNKLWYLTVAGEPETCRLQ